MGQRAALLSAAYTSGDRFEEGKEDLAFRTKPQLALTLIESALAAGVTFKAIVADAFQGEHIRLARIFTQRGLPYVLSHSGQKVRAGLVPSWLIRSRMRPKTPRCKTGMR